MPTLADFRADVLRESDSTGVVETTDLDPCINDGLSELHDILTLSFEDYALSSSDLTITAGNSSVALPATFYKGRGLDSLEDAANPREMRRFNWSDRGRRYMGKTYALIGANLQVRPTEDAPGNYRLWYVPLYVDLVASGDIYTAPNRWEQYGTLVAAARIKEMQELDSGPLVQRAERVRQRIVEAAKQRDAGYPKKVRDVKGWRRLGTQTETFDGEPW